MLFSGSSSHSKSFLSSSTISQDQHAPLYVPVDQTHDLRSEQLQYALIETQFDASVQKEFAYRRTDFQMQDITEIKNTRGDFDIAFGVGTVSNLDVA